MHDRPQLGVSACLMGERVRYDGGHKALDYASVLGRHFDLLHVCPEVAIGLGVPRPAMQLSEKNGRVRVHGIDGPASDVTDELVRSGADMAGQHSHLAGDLFKGRSPSCGLHEVPVYQADGTASHNGRGRFADALLRGIPALPAIQEDELDDVGAREQFFVCVYARHRFGQCSDQAARQRFHYCYSYALQARGQQDAQLAELLESCSQTYVSQLLSRLRAPVVRSCDAAIMRELCKRDGRNEAPPAELQRYSEGGLPRHEAAAAVRGLLPDTAMVDWFLHPFPHSLEDTSVSV
jgi:uncharacterized protein YbbK (DUF523 family)